MSEVYKGLTLNQYLDDNPYPNRPGIIENTNFHAIIDAVTADSLNPTNITLPQGKTALYGPGGIKKIFFNLAAPDNSPVEILGGIVPVGPGMNVVCIDGHARLHVHFNNDSNNNVAEFCFFSSFIGCISTNTVLFVGDPAIFFPYDVGEDSGGYCLYLSGPGFTGVPANISFVTRYEGETDVNIWGELTCRFKEAAI